MRVYDVEIENWGTEKVKAIDVEAAVEKAVSEYFWQDPPNNSSDWEIKAACEGKRFNVKAEPEVSFWVHEILSEIQKQFQPGTKDEGK